MVGSHAILHLVKAKHREIALHPEGKIGDIKLECYSCENKNIFDLGTISVLVDDEENLVVICRQCSPMEEYNKIKWDKDNFTPLIKEKVFDEWMLNQPNES